MSKSCACRSASAPPALGVLIVLPAGNKKDLLQASQPTCAMVSIFMSARSCSRRCISRSTATRCCRSVSTNLHHAWRKGLVTGQSRQAVGLGFWWGARLTPTCAHSTRTVCHTCSLTCTSYACSYLNSFRKILLQLNNSRERPHLNHSRMISYMISSYMISSFA